MKRFLDSFRRKNSPHMERLVARRGRCRPNLEQLEERAVPALPGVIPGGAGGGGGGGGFPSPPPPPPSSLSGNVYCDLNDNGRFNRGTEDGIAGVTIQLYRSRTGALVGTDITDAAGAYSFSGLRPGRYHIVEGTVPNTTDGKDTPGIVKGNPPRYGRRDANDILGVFLPAGRRGVNFNFGEHCASPGPGPDPVPGDICGRKYEDRDGDGTDDCGTDPGLGGITIRLWADDGDDILEYDEDFLLACTETAQGTGKYHFNDVSLPVGTCFVEEVCPPGYEQTAPCELGYHVIEVDADCERVICTGLDFGNTQTGDCYECVAGSITDVHYSMGDQQFDDLGGNTQQGATLTVTFTIPEGYSDIQVSFVTYTATQPYFDADEAHNQRVFDFDTSFFDAGTHTLTVTIPNCFYQVDLVCGPILWQLGPAGSDNFYSAQNRLIDSDNGGTNSCDCHC